MQYLRPSFSVFVGSDAFNEGWDRIFGAQSCQQLSNTASLQGDESVLSVTEKTNTNTSASPAGSPTPAK